MSWAVHNNKCKGNWMNGSVQLCSPSTITFMWKAGHGKCVQIFCYEYIIQCSEYIVCVVMIYSLRYLNAITVYKEELVRSTSARVNRSVVQFPSDEVREC